MAAALERRSRKLFPDLPPKDSAAGKVVQMLLQGNIAALYIGDTYRVFHCLEKIDLLRRKVIYLNCQVLPGLLATDFSRSLKGVTELAQRDPLLGQIVRQEVPNKTFFNLRKSFSKGLRYLWVESH